jgi:hypothetical protein
MWQKVAGISEQISCKTYDTNSFTDTTCNDWNSLDDCNWCAAKSYCADLNLWWYNDWRLWLNSKKWVAKIESIW